MDPNDDLEYDDRPEEIPYEEGEDLPPSALGTKEHWDQVYEREVGVFEETGDEGEVWFGESSVMKMVSWAITNIPPNPSSPITILECGCGNGTLLLSFLSPSKFHRPYTNSHFTGVDYSPASIILAKQVEGQRRNQGWRSLEEEDSVENDEVYDSDSGGEERDKRVELARGAKAVLGKGTIRWVVGDLLAPWEGSVEVANENAAVARDAGQEERKIENAASGEQESSWRSDDDGVRSNGLDTASLGTNIVIDRASPNPEQPSFDINTGSLLPGLTRLNIDNHNNNHAAQQAQEEQDLLSPMEDRPDNARHISTETVHLVNPDRNQSSPNDKPRPNLDLTLSTFSSDQTIPPPSRTASPPPPPPALVTRQPSHIRRAMSPDARRRRERQQQQQVFEREHMSPMMAEGRAKPTEAEAEMVLQHAVQSAVAAAREVAMDADKKDVEEGRRASAAAEAEAVAVAAEMRRGSSGTFPSRMDDEDGRAYDPSSLRPESHTSTGQAIRAFPEQSATLNSNASNNTTSNSHPTTTKHTPKSTYTPALDLSWQTTYDLVLDKGTYDALALSSDPVESDPAGRKPAEVYPERVSALVKVGGFFLITSCNFTEEQIEARFAKQELGFSFHSRVNHASFSFAGKKGSTVCTVAFQKTS